MVDTLTRYDSWQGPQFLADLWTLTRGGARLRCALSTHALGWELRVWQGDDDLRRSQVCKTEDAVFETSEAWQAEAEAKGWRREGVG